MHEQVSGMSCAVHSGQHKWVSNMSSLGQTTLQRQAVSLSPPSQGFRMHLPMSLLSTSTLTSPPGHALCMPQASLVTCTTHFAEVKPPGHSL
jgi:hypothetical protein